MSPDFAAQSPYAVRLEWGLSGVTEVANRGGVAVVVDVLSFSSCVDIACSRGARVFPYAFKDERAEAFARSQGAVLASRRGGGGLSLSPQSLLEIEAETKLVLPSPNGSTLSLACTVPVVLAGCLRNAAAVAAFAMMQTGAITVIAAGERWPDGSLRPALEDLLGAGAIVHRLAGEKSPEAKVAEMAFVAARDLRLGRGVNLQGLPRRRSAGRAARRERLRADAAGRRLRRGGWGRLEVNQALPT